MVLTYWFLFFRVVLMVVFSISLVTKVADWSGYRSSVNKFELLPQSLVHVVSDLLLLVEALVLLLLLLWPLFGFLLAFGLLSIFTGALWQIWRQKRAVACHCFGAKATPISVTDLIRNGGLLGCAGSGVWLMWLEPTLPPLSFLEVAVTSLIALISVLLWIHLGEIYTLLQAGQRQQRSIG